MIRIKERIEILKILAAQAAISIENSLLYANLEEKVKERTAQLEDAHKKILMHSLIKLFSIKQKKRLKLPVT